MTRCPEYTELADLMAREIDAEFPPGQPLNPADQQRKTSIQRDRDRILGRHLATCPNCTDIEGETT